MQKSNMTKEIDAKLKIVALNDQKLGLLQGKLGACVYFFIMSNHNEKNENFQVGKELLTQVVSKIQTVKNIDLNNGLIGIYLGISYLVENNYISDSSGKLLLDIDAYIYKIAMNAIEMNLQGKETAPLIDVLAFEIYRYWRLDNGVEKEFCQRFIEKLFNTIYMNRPLDFYSEAMPFKANNRLIVFLFALVEIRNLGISTERIDRIFQEMQPFLFSLRPVLHPNKYCLFLASSLVAQVTSQSQWKFFSENLRKEIDMSHLLSNDLFDQSVMLQNGVLGLFALTWWYNQKSLSPIGFDMEKLKQRIENSSFWNHVDMDEEFLYSNYSLNSYCGIKLLTRIWENNDNKDKT